MHRDTPCRACPRLIDNTKFVLPASSLTATRNDPSSKPEARFQRVPETRLISLQLLRHNVHGETLLSLRANRSVFFFSTLFSSVASGEEPQELRGRAMLSTSFAHSTASPANFSSTKRRRMTDTNNAWCTVDPRSPGAKVKALDAESRVPPLLLAIATRRKCIGPLCLIRRISIKAN